SLLLFPRRPQPDRSVCASTSIFSAQNASTAYADPAVARASARVSIALLWTMEDPAAQDDSVPLATIGRYVLYGPMAAGGIATVHFARAFRRPSAARSADRGSPEWRGGEPLENDDEGSPVVAVKRLHARYALDPGFATMFVDEARIAARIRDPNVIEVVDVVSDGGVLFLVMPYVH